MRFWIGLGLLVVAACSGRVRVESDPNASGAGGAFAIGGSADFAGAPAIDPALGGAVEISGGALEIAGGAAGDAGAGGEAGAPPSTTEGVVLQLDQCSGLQLALDENALFISDALFGSVYRVGLADNALTRVARAQKAPTSIVAHHETVFWVSSGENGLYRARNGAIEQLLAATSPIHGLGLDDSGTTLFYSYGSGVIAFSLIDSTNGGYFVTRGDGNQPGALAAFGTHVAYPTATEVDVLEFNSKWRADCRIVDATRSHCVRVVEGELALNTDSIALTDSAVYWAGGAWVYSAPPTITSGPRVTVFTSDALRPISRFALARDTLYAANNAGTIMMAKLPTPELPNPTSKVLRRKQGNVTSLVGSAERVFWATDGCVVRGVAAE
jgi:hypothetical protein